MPLILVIDDDDQVRGLLKDMLERAGYEVLEAQDGNIGLQLFRAHSVDITITDILMPEKEGLETIMDIRKESPHAKIIAISGGAKVGPFAYLKLAERFGAQRVFSKPLKMATLLQAVEELLEEKSLPNIENHID
jgi:CheY-like chemotaxis protein